MTAIMTSKGLGVQQSSAFVLGSAGLLGDPSLGRAGQNVYVNAASGNLVLQKIDELLMGRGPDAAIGLTYNSLGTLSDDNGDNWRPSASRKLINKPATPGSAGSTVTRVDWDGSEVVYSWDATRNAYVSKEGAGAYDTLTFASGVWTWRDGSTESCQVSPRGTIKAPSPPGI